MDIQKYVKEAHENAVKHGFYENQVDIDQKIDLICTELGEIIDADRKGKHSDYIRYKELLDFIVSNKNNDLKNKMYDIYMKDTIEDEIADVFIRIFSLVGYLEKPLKPCYKEFNNGLYKNIRIALNTVTSFNLPLINNLSKTLKIMEDTCYGIGIDIEPYIIQKMLYNRDRPYKHGKEY